MSIPATRLVSASRVGYGDRMQIEVLTGLAQHNGFALGDGPGDQRSETTLTHQDGKRGGGSAVR